MKIGADCLLPATGSDGVALRHDMSRGRQDQRPGKFDRWVRPISRVNHSDPMIARGLDIDRRVSRFVAIVKQLYRRKGDACLRPQTGLGTGMSKNQKHPAGADLRAVPLPHRPSSPSFRSASVDRIRRDHRIGPSLRGRRLSVGRSPAPDHDVAGLESEVRSERRQSWLALLGERRSAAHFP